MIHTVIVPGVGGSEDAHWQSWLQRQLISSSRVQQHDWHQPVLAEWIEAWVAHVGPAFQVQYKLFAHSFGCLVSVAELAATPETAK